MRSNFDIGQRKKPVGWPVALVLIVVLITAFFTNPTNDSYGVWVKDQLRSGKYGTFDESLVEMITPEMIKEYTEREDYLFFTVFKTRAGEFESKTLGLFQQFFLLDMTGNLQ
jgi:hypothetical protein